MKRIFVKQGICLSLGAGNNHLELNLANIVHVAANPKRSSWSFSATTEDIWMVALSSWKSTFFLKKCVRLALVYPSVAVVTLYNTLHLLFCLF